MSFTHSTKKPQNPDTAARKAHKLEYNRKWSKTPEGIASLQKYRRSAKFREAQKRFSSSPKGRTLKAKHCRKNGLKVRMESLYVYSNGDMKCSCCGESNIGFLTLDHVNSDGAYHRKRSAGSRLAWKLRRLGWPKDPPMQVLCYNCNCGRQYNGGICPHHGLIGTDASRKAVPVGQRTIKNETYDVSLFDADLECGKSSPFAG